MEKEHLQFKKQSTVLLIHLKLTSDLEEIFLIIN